MKTIALMPIKLGSKRVPQKNIKPFFDGTLLMHFIQKISYNFSDMQYLPYIDNIYTFGGAA